MNIESGSRVRELEEKLLELARIHHRSHEGIAPSFQNCSVITCQEVSATLATREDTERPDARLTADEHKAIRCALEFGVPPGSDPLLESAKAKLRQQETLVVRDTER
jgi:hypothetical protein